MELAFGILMIVTAAISAVVVVGLFVYAAVKDGQDNDAVQAQLEHRERRRSG
jgi:hypothetical protein